MAEWIFLALSKQTTLFLLAMALVAAVDVIMTDGSRLTACWKWVGGLRCSPPTASPQQQPPAAASPPEQGGLREVKLAPLITQGTQIKARQADGHDSVAAYADHRRASKEMPATYFANETAMKVREIDGEWLLVERGWVKRRNVVAIEEGGDLGAVILTIRGANSSSYDRLFTSVPQLGPDGARVAVYQANYSDLQAVLDCLQDPGSVAPEVYKQLAQDVYAVEASAFVLNLECCGCCDDTGFNVQEKPPLWNLLDFCVKRQSFVMASDFSLKAIIADWRSSVLGANPFTRVSLHTAGGLGQGGCSSSFQLRFDPEILKACPSAQLATVGELCPEGKAGVRAQGGTITFGIDKAAAAAATAAGATLEVLTVVDVVDGLRIQAAHLHDRGCIAAGISGLAGHVLLTLPSGGKLLASMGHWMELSQLGVTEEALFATAKRRGARYEAEVRTELDRCTSPRQRHAVYSRRGRELIQSSAPCRYNGAN